MASWTPAKKFLALGAAIGTGLLVFHCRRRYAEHNNAPVTLDPALDNRTRRVALAALTREHDPAVLDAFAGFLSGAGYERTAHAVGSRATYLRAAGL